VIVVCKSLSESDGKELGEEVHCAVHSGRWNGKEHQSKDLRKRFIISNMELTLFRKSWKFKVTIDLTICPFTSASQILR
jgi:hypothetical protein